MKISKKNKSLLKIIAGVLTAIAIVFGINYTLGIVFTAGVLSYWLLLFRGLGSRWKKNWRNRRSAYLWILLYLIILGFITLPAVESEIEFLKNPKVLIMLFFYLGLLTSFFSHLPFTKNVP